MPQNKPANAPQNSAETMPKVTKYPQLFANGNPMTEGKAPQNKPGNAPQNTLENMKQKTNYPDLYVNGNIMADGKPPQNKPGNAPQNTIEQMRQKTNYPDLYVNGNIMADGKPPQNKPGDAPQNSIEKMRQETNYPDLYTPEMMKDRRVVADFKLQELKESVADSHRRFEQSDYQRSGKKWQAAKPSGEPKISAKDQPLGTNSPTEAARMGETAKRPSAPPLEPEPSAPPLEPEPSAPPLEPESRQQQTIGVKGLEALPRQPRLPVSPSKEATGRETGAPKLGQLNPKNTHSPATRLAEIMTANKAPEKPSNTQATHVRGLPPPPPPQSAKPTYGQQQNSVRKI